jgi:hypothetical protein
MCLSGHRKIPFGSADPAVLEDLAARLTAAAATLRRYVEHGEVPLLGGAWDPHNRDWWWQD